MSTIFPANQLPFVYFATGLAWIAISLGMLHSRRWGTRVSPWLIACLALEGGAGWMEAIVVRAAAQSGWHMVSVIPGTEGFHGLELVRMAMLIGSFVSLVEYGVQRLARHRGWLPNRWIYAAAAVLLAIGAATLPRPLLAMAICALRAWPGVVAAGIWLYSLPMHKRFTSRLAMLAFHTALLLAALASCVAPPTIHMLVSLAATLPAWRMLARRGAAQTHAASTGASRAAGKSRSAAPQISAWRRAAPPAVFVLALAAGWFALATNPRPITPLADEQEIAALVDELKPPADEPKSDRDSQLERYGLALAPLAGLVFAVWGLSRLPFAR